MKVDNEGAQLLFQSYGEERRGKLSISRPTCLAFRHPPQPSILARQMVVLSCYVRPPFSPPGLRGPFLMVLSQLWKISESLRSFLIGFVLINVL